MTDGWQLAAHSQSLYAIDETNGLVSEVGFCSFESGERSSDKIEYGFGIANRGPEEQPPPSGSTSGLRGLDTLRP